MLQQNFTVINAQVSRITAMVTIGGVPTSADFLRGVIEAEPAEPGGKTLTLIIPPDSVVDYAPGDVIQITVKTAAELAAEAAAEQGGQ